MARVEYGAIITDINGSIGGFTFQQNKAGKIVRLRPGTQKTPTSKQTVAQSRHSGFLAGWQNLSIADKEAWNDFADLHTKTDRWGQDKTLTGQNWYESINQVLLQLSIPNISSPPTYSLPPAVPVFDVILTASDLEIDFNPNFQPTDTDLVIWSTQPVSRVTDSLRSQFRLTKVVTGDNYGTINLTSDWEDTHQIPWPPSSNTSCFVVGIMVVACDRNSGICGVGVINKEGYDEPITGIGFMEIGNTFVVS